MDAASNTKTPSTARVATSFVSQPRTMPPRSPRIRITGGAYGLATQPSEHRADQLVELGDPQPPGEGDVADSEDGPADHESGERAGGPVAQRAEDAEHDQRGDGRTRNGRHEAPHPGSHH